MTNTISILGSGWLGLPLAQHFDRAGYTVQVSTRTESRLRELLSYNLTPYIVDLDKLDDVHDDFFNASVLIVNITSKNVAGFSAFISKVERSVIESVLFISSTSVYPDNSGTVKESSGLESPESALVQIENLFKVSKKFKTTIVRFGGLIGYARNPGRFFAGGKSIKNSDAVVNLIHRDDCIGIINEIVRQNVWSETFNCCADTHPTKRALYTQAAQKYGLPAPQCALSDSTSYKKICNTKVKRVLNYSFLHPDVMSIEYDVHR